MHEKTALVGCSPLPNFGYLAQADLIPSGFLKEKMFYEKRSLSQMQPIIYQLTNNSLSCSILANNTCYIASAPVDRQWIENTCCCTKWLHQLYQLYQSYQLLIFIMSIVPIINIVPMLCLLPNVDAYFVPVKLLVLMSSDPVRPLGCAMACSPVLPKGNGISAAKHDQRWLRMVLHCGLEWGVNGSLMVNWWWFKVNWSFINGEWWSVDGLSLMVESLWFMANWWLDNRWVMIDTGWRWG